jgi:hypothetical protein
MYGSQVFTKKYMIVLLSTSAIIAEYLICFTFADR